MSLSETLEALKERGHSLMNKLNHQADTEEIAKFKRYYKRTGDVDFQIRLLDEYVKELDKMEQGDVREKDYLFDATQIIQNLVKNYPLIVPEKTVDCFGMMFYKKYGKNDLVPKLFEAYGTALINEKKAVARSRNRLNIAEAKIEMYKESRQKLEPTFRSPLKLEEELVSV